MYLYMPMGSTKPAPVNVLHLFYGLNVVIALLVLTIGAEAILWLWRHHRFPPTYRSTNVARRTLALGLGSLWLLDGLLQAQPAMVTEFVKNFLAPELVGQPAWVASLLKVSIRFWNLHPVLWNLGATWLQIGIGLLLLLGGESRWQRFGLWVSIAWGTIVWLGGEALGGTFSQTSWLSGFPGSVFLYLVAAILLLLPSNRWESSRFIHSWRIGFSLLWGLAAFFQADPASGWWHPHALSNYVRSLAVMPQPQIFSAPLTAWSHLLSYSPFIWNAALIAIFLGLGCYWGLGRPSRWGWGLTFGVTFFTWWLGQDFGVLGGMGTDPNTGIVVLLGLVVYARLDSISIGPHRRQTPPPRDDTEWDSTMPSQVDAG